jgi:hypothetical protein
MPEEETTTHGRTAAVPVADPSPVAATRPGGSASRGPTRLVVLLGALTAFSPLAIDMSLPAFPQIERGLAAPAGTLPLTLSLFLACLALGQLVCGGWVPEKSHAAIAPVCSEDSGCGAGGLIAAPEFNSATMSGALHF